PGSPYQLPRLLFVLPLGISFPGLVPLINYHASNSSLPPRRAGVIRHSYFLTGHHFPAWFPLSITTSLVVLPLGYPLPACFTLSITTPLIRPSRHGGQASFVIRTSSQAITSRPGSPYQLPRLSSYLGNCHCPNRPGCGPGRNATMRKLRPERRLWLIPVPVLRC